MSKNLFCYKIEKDILEDNKASENNQDCNGCVYIKVCERDLNKGIELSNVEVSDNNTNVETEEVNKKENRKNENDSFKKNSRNNKPNRKKPKNKPSLEDLAEMDIF